MLSLDPALHARREGNAQKLVEYNIAHVREKGNVVQGRGRGQEVDAYAGMELDAYARQ